MAENNKAIKQQLISHLNGGEAFVRLSELLPKIPFDKLEIRPTNLPYSVYELFYHICFTQKDLLNYCLKQNYTAPNWPEDYWPKSKAPANQNEWQELQNQFDQTQKSLIALLKKEETDLLQPVASNKKHHLLREIELVIEHNAYHSGQLVILLRLLGVIEN